MSDIALSPIDDCFDLLVQNGDLKGDEGLETAVAISIFTDRRITDDELPDLETDKRGWWGDMFPDEPNDQIGSRLWLIDRAKRTSETLRRFEELIEEALNWMIEDGVTDSIDVNAEYVDGQLIGTIEIARPSEDVARFEVLWDAQELRRS